MKKIVGITILIIFIIISGFTTYKVVKNHREKLYLVTEKRIIEAAFKCINEKKCTNYPVTLNQLYDNKYLYEEINPVTKEVYNYDSYVTNKEGKLEFIVLD